MRFAVLLLLFFASGACALIYQILWLRLLSLIFGVTVYAASTVLAAFMAGLALGSALAGPIVARVRRPLRVFGLAEILIGFAVLATPMAFNLSAMLYQRVYHLSPESMALLTVARLISGFVVLLIPTVLMGLTLPALSASVLVRGSRFGARVSSLYAVNTAGAVAGAVVTGFYLIGAIGIQRSFVLGAALNIAIGLVALLLDRLLGAESTVIEQAAVKPASLAELGTALHKRITLVVAVSGLVALALEIVWFRMLVQYFTATTYAFTTMLATVLGGIAFGGALATPLLRRDRDWVAWLIVIQVATACLTLGSAIFLGWSYAAGWKTSSDLQGSAAAILPVTVLMGLGFPIAIRIAACPLRGEMAAATASRVGRLYAVNVIGGIAGALLAGFVLIPLLGTRRSLIALAAVYGVSVAALLIGRTQQRRLLVLAGAAAAAFVLLAVRVPDPFATAYARRYGEDMREFWREEGVQTAVSVHASEFRRSLYLDGLHQGNDGPEMVRFHRILGHLPMVLHPSPHDVLVIGLGGGSTSGAVSQHPARVQVVELSESVRRAASFFVHVNYDVLKQPNVRVRVDDGRNFLLLSGEKFDVITADIIQPIHAGAGHVYSREYFWLQRNALKENGLVVQWIGHPPLRQYQLIMRTFLEVFPHATLWYDGNVMIGSVTPLRLHEATLAFKRANPRTAAALDDIGLSSFETLRAWFTAGPDEMRRLVGRGPVLTDDRPLLEYHRSLPAGNDKLDLSSLRGDVREITQ